MEKEVFKQGNGFVEYGQGDFNMYVPYSSLKRGLEDDHLILKAGSAFQVWGRLNGIRALSFLSYVGSDYKNRESMGYIHTRGSHELGVALIAGEIGRLNNLSEARIAYLEITAIAHDSATPALGDACKSIDYQHLDEEKFWIEMVDESGQKIMDENNLTVEKMDDIINNRGSDGTVQDIADRIEYTMTDVENVLKGIPDDNPYLMELRMLIAQNPNIGDIYQDVVVDAVRDLVYFNNPKRLATFLEIRALMSKNLYYHPTSQGRDLLVANLIRPLYATDLAHILNPQILRKMTDSELLTALAIYHDFPRHQGGWLYKNLTNWHPNYERFKSWEEAEEKAKTIEREFLVIGIKECREFDAGLSYLTVDGNKNIVPFEKAEPTAARRLKEIQEEIKAVYVYYTDISENTPVNRLLRRIYWKPQFPAIADEAEIE